MLTLAAVGVMGGNLKRRIEQIMNARDVPGLSFAKKAALAIAGAAVLIAPVLVGIANAPAILAQSPSEVPEWQAAAGGRMAFEVASVKLLKPGSGGRAPNFALDEGDGFTDPLSGARPHGRLSSAFPVSVYISFAYKLSLTPDQRQAMLAGLPKWVDTDRIDIEAKAAGDPTKDQMRLMMQSLLAERFHLAVHYETPERHVGAKAQSARRRTTLRCVWAPEPRDGHVRSRRRRVSRSVRIADVNARQEWTHGSRKSKRDHGSPRWVSGSDGWTADGRSNRDHREDRLSVGMDP